MNEPIAVITDNFPRTFYWLQREYGKEIERIDKMRGIFTLKNKSELVIVTNLEQIRGMEFSGYILDPHFFDILAEVKVRIRK
jgi:hypothetical protein